ncbi:AIPR family protein [Spirosoma flavum]|uniref:AIPR family protein n=1 Tax=Spirosoma flavum TaxID=2048557 RepID=A0ABW6AR39_9BACT
MSVVHINQIKQKVVDLFQDKLDLKDVPVHDKDREDKIITRCLAAYAIYNNIECTVDEAAQSVIDAGDDHGIDAIYYSPINKLMLIVQSKFRKDGTGEPDSAAVGKFCDGIKDLFEMNFDRFNDKFYKKQNIIEGGLREYDTKYLMILIDTCSAKELAKHASTRINDLLDELNNTGDESSDPIISYIRMNQSKIYDTLALSAGNNPINIELGLTQWGSIVEPYKAIYGAVSGQEVAGWWNNYNNRLFEKNIRQVLGMTDVNEEIEKTLKENPTLFWYFNNGITIICDKIDKNAVGGGSRDLGAFKLTNIAIVNGAQTVSTIGKYAQRNPTANNLENVKVNIRLIQLSDTFTSFGKDVTKSNNRQNRIENRDFVSQDQEQQRIKAELSIDRIEYNIMRSENYVQNDNSFELTEATVALACASGKTSLAVQAKSGIGKFYEDLDRGIYKEIFNASVSGYYVYNCVKTIRFIENVLKREIAALLKRSGRKYGILIHGNRMIELLTIKKLNIKKDLDTIDYIVDGDNVTAKVMEVIDDIHEFIETSYPESFLATLFKNTTKCTELFNSVNTSRT